jgi:hypothetical protein
MPKASRSTYHRLVRGSHSRWEPGVGTNPDTNLPNPGQRVVYVAGNPDYPDTMPNLTEAELATLGSRAQVVDGPPEEAEEGGEKYIAPVAKATTPVRPHDRNRPAPAAPRDYSGISDLNAQDASKLVAEAGTAEEVEGLMAAEEASDKPRKTVLDAGERRLAQLKERDEDEE